MSEWVGVASIAVSAVGSGAVVCALLYSGKEVRVLRAQLALENTQAGRELVTRRASNDLELMGHTMALDRLFIEIPELRPYFYDPMNAVPEAEPMRSRVLATAELIVDLADSAGSMIAHGQLDDSDPVAWGAALASYGESPAVRQILEEDEEIGAWRPQTLALLRGELDLSSLSSARDFVGPPAPTI